MFANSSCTRNRSAGSFPSFYCIQAVQFSRWSRIEPFARRRLLDVRNTLDTEPTRRGRVNSFRRLKISDLIDVFWPISATTWATTAGVAESSGATSSSQKASAVQHDAKSPRRQSSIPTSVDFLDAVVSVYESLELDVLIHTPHPAVHCLARMRPRVLPQPKGFLNGQPLACASLNTSRKNVSTFACTEGRSRFLGNSEQSHTASSSAGPANHRNSRL